MMTHLSKLKMKLHLEPRAFLSLTLSKTDLGKGKVQRPHCPPQVCVLQASADTERKLVRAHSRKQGEDPQASLQGCGISRGGKQIPLKCRGSLFSSPWSSGGYI